MEEQNCGNSRADEFLRDIVSLSSPSLSLYEFLFYRHIASHRCWLPFGIVSSQPSSLALGSDSKSLYHNEKVSEVDLQLQRIFPFLV